MYIFILNNCCEEELNLLNNIENKILTTHTCTKCSKEIDFDIVYHWEINFNAGDLRGDVNARFDKYSIINAKYRDQVSK